MLKDIYNKLFKAYGPQHWWPAGSPFEMMVGAILTQNTSWANVDKALKNFGSGLSPNFILSTSTEELIEIIRPSGFFNQKAARLKTLTLWFKGYDFDIDTLKSQDPKRVRCELLCLNGVGRETADSIMLYALDKPFFVIDAYTCRIFIRLGYEFPDDYEGIRAIFEGELKRDYKLYNEFHALIVHHAKLHCKAIPDCYNCTLKNECRAVTTA